MNLRRHCLLACGLVLGSSAAQAQLMDSCVVEGGAASPSMPCHPAADSHPHTARAMQEGDGAPAVRHRHLVAVEVVPMMRGAVMMAEAAGAGSVAVPVLPVDAVQVDGGGSVPWAGRRAADLPWPDGLAFGMRQAEVQALVPAAVPPRRDGDWAVLAEDRMAVQVLAAMVAGQEGMGGRSRLVEPVTVAGLALDAHHHFVMNRLTVVLAMPTQGWMAHEQAMAAHASLGQWLTARHGQPRVVQAPGRGRRVQVAHSEWSLPDGRTVVLVVLPGGGGRSLLALGLRL